MFSASVIDLIVALIQRNIILPNILQFFFLSFSNRLVLYSINRFACMVKTLNHQLSRCLEVPLNGSEVKESLQIHSEAFIDIYSYDCMTLYNNIRFIAVTFCNIYKNFNMNY